MAFSIEILNEYTQELQQTYSRASLNLCTKALTEVRVIHYVSKEAASLGATPLKEYMLSFETNLELDSDNPIDYAYKTLEQSKTYSDAKWNV